MEVSGFNEVKLDNTADSIESCGFPGLENYFVCSTYELIASSQQRVGSVNLFEVKFVFCKFGTLCRFFNFV